MPLGDRLTLRKSDLIEFLYDLLKSVFEIEPIQHRSPIHIFAGLLAYSFYRHKPSMGITPQKSIYP